MVRIQSTNSHFPLVIPLPISAFLLCLLHSPLASWFLSLHVLCIYTAFAQDRTETDVINLRRVIYLTIMSSMDFEEVRH
jgi:hypothetical protein